MKYLVVMIGADGREHLAGPLSQTKFTSEYDAKCLMRELKAATNRTYAIVTTRN